MRKLFLTLGFTSVFFLSSDLIASTEPSLEETLKSEISRKVSSALSAYNGARNLTLTIPNSPELFARFRSVFHDNVDELVGIATSLVPLGTRGATLSNFLTVLFERQEAKNAEAETKAAAAAASRGKTYGGLATGFGSVTDADKMEGLATSLAEKAVKSAVRVSILEGQIAETQKDFQQLEGQKPSYDEAGDLVKNVADWVRSHQLDPSITEPIPAATAWVARRQARFDANQRDADKKTKLALAKAVLTLVTASSTLDAMNVATAAYKAQVGEAKAKLAELQTQLKEAKKSSAASTKVSAAAASRVEALSPKPESPSKWSGRFGLSPKSSGGTSSGSPSTK